MCSVFCINSLILRESVTIPKDIFEQALVIFVVIAHAQKLFLNPFMPNAIAMSHFYKLDQFISVLRAGNFPFYSNFNRTFSKLTEETLIRRR